MTKSPTRSVTAGAASWRGERTAGGAAHLPNPTGRHTVAPVPSDTSEDCGRSGVTCQDKQSVPTEQTIQTLEKLTDQTAVTYTFVLTAVHF